MTRLVRTISDRFQYSPARTNELLLAARGKSAVSGIHEFRHGIEGHYNYGMYRVQRLPNGNLGLVLSLYRISWTVKDEASHAVEKPFTEEEITNSLTKIGSLNMTKNDVNRLLAVSSQPQLSMSYDEKEYLIEKFNKKAKSLFQTNCPKTIMNIERDDTHVTDKRPSTFVESDGQNRKE